MQIALCYDENQPELFDTLNTLYEVKNFANGVDLAYYLQKTNHCDLVVISVDGAKGMNFCSYARGQNEKIPILWISDQSDFYNQSLRIPVDAFFSKPCSIENILEVTKGLLRERPDG